MAMGKPIIASDIGGHRELIRDGYTGVLFKSGDISEVYSTDHYSGFWMIQGCGIDWQRRGLDWVHQKIAPAEKDDFRLFRDLFQGPQERVYVRSHRICEVNLAVQSGAGQ